VIIRSKFPAQETTIFSVMSALANRYGAINLSQGFPNFEPDNRLMDLVSEAMRNGFNQYAPMAGHVGLRSVLADKHERSCGHRPDPEHEITITAGATQALFTAISALVAEGDEVIYFEPAYDSYRPAILLNGALPVAVRLRDPEFRIDWDEVGKLVTDRTRMVIINTPNNPGCYAWTENDWLELEKRVAGKNIVILSDEVYEHLVFAQGGHHSVLSRQALAGQRLAVFSFGKNFHMTGWKVGYIAGAAELMEEFRKLHQYLVFSVHHPSQEAIMHYLRQPDNYLGLAAFYREKYEFFLDACEGSSFRFLPSGGSYFVLADYRGVRDTEDREFAEWMTKEVGVATIPLSPFYSNPPQGQRLVRFCFAKTRDVLAEAGRRIQGI